MLRSHIFSSCQIAKIDPNFKILLSYWFTFKFRSIFAYWHDQKVDFLVKHFPYQWLHPTPNLIRLENSILSREIVGHKNANVKYFKSSGLDPICFAQIFHHTFEVFRSFHFRNCSQKLPNVHSLSHGLRKPNGAFFIEIQNF